MKVKVDVPATNGRKAYSYFREGGEEGSPQAKPAPKAVQGRKRAIAATILGVGGLALGGAALAGLALTNKKKKLAGVEDEPDLKDTWKGSTVDVKAEDDFDRLKASIGRKTSSTPIPKQSKEEPSSFVKTFVDKDNVIDVESEEVKDPKEQKRLKGFASKVLSEGKKRGRGRPKTKFTPKDFVDPQNKREESLYSRIDSFISLLKEHLS